MFTVLGPAQEYEQPLEVTYPNEQPPQTWCLHRWRQSHSGHSPGFQRQRRRLVLATRRLSGPIIWPPAAFPRPGLMHIFPSSNRTLRRTGWDTPGKVLAIFSFSCFESKLPRLSHRVLMTNVEMGEVIIDPGSFSEATWWAAGRSRCGSLVTDKRTRKGKQLCQQ